VDKLKLLALALFLGGGFATLTGCEEDAFEEAGEEIDDAVDDAGDR
jgi:hypothetical protein